MTFRAVLIGLVLSVALASLGYINDTWFFFSYIGGDLVPTHAYGLLLIGLLLVNPLLRLIRRFQFKGGEWAVILSMMFMGSVLAGSAFFWQMPHPIITPIQDQVRSPGWKEKDILQYAPRVTMVEQVFREYASAHKIERKKEETWRQAVERAKEEGVLTDDAFKKLDAQHKDILTDYMQGKATPGKMIRPFADVPWYAWRDTMFFWFAVLGLITVAGVCAVVIVHRQWADREHLSYPIVTFTNELLAYDGKGLFNSIFRNRLFWIGFAVSFGILFVNGYQKWRPGFITIPVQINLNAFREMAFVEDLMKVDVGRNWLNVQFFFAAVGIAYFLSSEASFSLGISGLLYVLAAAPLVVLGVNMSKTMLGGGLPANMYFGAYLGMGVMVLYLGRRFYWAVLKRAFGVPGPSGEVLGRETWACRILIIVCAGLVVLLGQLGLHPVLAIGYVLLTGLLFLMLARINVATGLFMIQPIWQPVSILLPLFGAYAIGPHALGILAMLCIVVSIDTRISVVPLVANALKLADRQKVKAGWMGGWLAVALIVSLVVALPITVYLVYNVGLEGMRSEGTNWALAVAKMPFQLLSTTIDKLDSTGQLEAAREGTRLLSMRPEKHFFTSVGIGLALVLGCSYLRLRFSRWPLHPLVFLVWGTPWMVEYAPSFLLAWLLKGVIMKYGGQRSYHRAKSFFVGLVTGEFAAALLWGVVGAIYYLQTNTVGKNFLTRP